MIRKCLIVFVCLPTLLCASLSTLQAQSLEASTPTQLAVGVNNTAPNGESDQLALSPNSKLLVFRSASDNLVADDFNEKYDIFLRAADGTITKESVSSDGHAADADSQRPCISQVTANGAFGIAFLSRSSTFVEGLTTPEREHDQVYLRLPHIKKTILISRGTDGKAALGVSNNPQVVAFGNGEKFLVAFDSDAYNLPDAAPEGPNGHRPKRIFFAIVTVTDGEPAVETLRGFIGANGMQADGHISNPVLSGYGDKMLFRTNASNLGWANPTGLFHIASAIKGGSIELVSKSPTDGSPGDANSEAPSISFNGTVYAFKTESSNILGGSPLYPSVVAYSTATKTYSLVNSTADGVRGDSSVHDSLMVDPKGRFIAFIDKSSNYLPSGTDTNDRDDVFVKDLETKKILRVNVGAGSAQETDGYVGGPVLGTLGYASQVTTVGFFSNGSVLRQVGSSELSEVYRSELTSPPPPLNNTTKIEAPPEVVPGVQRLTLRFQKFGAVVSIKDLRNVWGMATKVTYEARLRNTSTKKNLKVISTKNRVTLRNITPGTYTVKYRVIGTPPKGKKITTRYSPSATATVRSN